MKHVRVVMEAEKMSRVGGFLNCKQGVPVAAASRGVDPFQNSACRELTLCRVSLEGASIMVGDSSRHTL